MLTCGLANADIGWSGQDRIPLLREQAVAFEHGNGARRDGTQAAALYCEAARLGDAASQFDLGWMYANGRGVKRDDGLAAFFFAAAAEQGIAQAREMLLAVGPPQAELPDCMKAPEPPLLAQPEPSEPPQAPRPIAAPRAIVEIVNQFAPRYRIAPQLALAIIQAESNFDSAAASPKNAQGLMQLIPETAARFNVKNAYDPRQNVQGGMAYLRWLLAYFEGDLSLVLAAYNAGERTVERYRGIPPYAETRTYVQRVLKALGTRQHPYDATFTSPSPHLRRIREVTALR